METRVPARFRLQELLEAAEMSQSELARRTGISFTTINAIANNKTKQVQLETLDRLADALSVEIGELLERVGKRRAR
jgi:DNA-binding Xre family transcriptional regulator